VCARPLTCLGADATISDSLLGEWFASDYSDYPFEPSVGRPPAPVSSHVLAPAPVESKDDDDVEDDDDDVDDDETPDGPSASELPKVLAPAPTSMDFKHNDDDDDDETPDGPMSIAVESLTVHAKVHLGPRVLVHTATVMNFSAWASVAAVKCVKTVAKSAKSAGVHSASASTSSASHRPCQLAH
jgi:hypothetical protein